MYAISAEPFTEPFTCDIYTYSTSLLQHCLSRGGGPRKDFLYAALSILPRATLNNHIIHTYARVLRGRCHRALYIFFTFVVNVSEISMRGKQHGQRHLFYYKKVEDCTLRGHHSTLKFYVL